MHDMGTNILFRAFCALADGTASVINSSLAHFADEYEEHVRLGRCPLREESGGGARVSADLVTLTIDGKEVTVPKGTLIIRAAEQVGVQIPRFCDHPYLEPAGACRQCYVQIEGQPKLATSCTVAVAPGMVVSTQNTSEPVQQAQVANLEFLLLNHPLDCPVCDRGGECPLQDQALAYGPGESRFTEAKRTFPKPIPMSPLIGLDRERCVLCARCTRFCDEISGDRFLELYARGAGERVSIAAGEDLRSPFSGNVVQICPVGALTATPYRFVARPFDLTSADTVCRHCSAGCAVRVDQRRGEVVRVLARENPDVNDAWICDKGRFAFGHDDAAGRITTPLVRDRGLEPTSFGEALTAVADACRGARVGVLAGGRLLDEDAYALSKLARTVLRTNDLDHRRAPHGGSAERVGRRRRRRGDVPRHRARRRDRGRRARCRAGGADPASASAEGRRARGPDRGARGAPDPAARRRRARARASRRRGRHACRDRVERPTTSAPRWPPPATAGSSWPARGWRSTTAPRTPPSRSREPTAPDSRGSPGAPAITAPCAPACTPRSARADDAWTTTEERAELEAVWGPVMTEADGRDTTEILRAAAEHELDVLYLVGVDPLRDAPDAALARRALQNVGTVVVQSMELGDLEPYVERLPAGRVVPRARRARERLGGPQPTGPSAARRRRDQPAGLGDLRGARGRRPVAIWASTRWTNCTRRWPVCGRRARSR